MLCSLYPGSAYKPKAQAFLTLDVSGILGLDVLAVPALTDKLGMLDPDLLTLSLPL